MKNNNIKIFIIAGEVSGDVLGAKIMAAMPDTKFVGIGGENMKSMGLRSLFPISDLAVMGLVEVLANARTLTCRINQTVDAILREKPDIVLTIDSPSFAKRVIKKVKKQEAEIKFYHIVAPQVWAWGAHRAAKFAKIFDRLYAFFDFEKPYFEKYGLPTIAVGHPIADKLKVIRSNHIRPIKNIALIPGSRMSEVKKLLPIFERVAECLPDCKFTIPVVETTKKYIRDAVSKWAVRPELTPAAQRYDAFAKTDIAIAASGTVSAELAIMHIPAIIVYKMNPLTEFLARQLVRVKWVSLVNILLKKSVYPELLGGRATCENIISEIEKLAQPRVRAKMISDLKSADKLWRKNNKNAAALIAADILAH